MEDKKWTVYVHIVSKEISGYANDKYYVGITCQDVKKRWGYSTGIHYRKSTKFYKVIEKYGFDKIEHFIFANNLTYKEAYKIEEKLIKKLKSNEDDYGYNMTLGLGQKGRANVKQLSNIHIENHCLVKDKFISKMFINKNNNDYSNEVWKPIIGYEDYYEVSNYGRVRSLDRYVKLGGKQKNDSLALKRGKILNEKDNGNGYKTVHLTVNRKTIDKYVHRLVAESFLSNEDKSKTQVNHKDENKGNNCLDNLEWCTPSYNDTYGSHLDTNSKKVVMLDLDLNFIDEFNSCSEAERLTKSKGISAVCNGRRITANGYKWMFKSKYEDMIRRD